MYTGVDNNELEAESEEAGKSQQESIWKIKERRRKFQKKVFGEHYNYNYRRPNQNVHVSLFRKCTTFRKTATPKSKEPTASSSKKFKASSNVQWARKK